MKKLIATLALAALFAAPALALDGKALYAEKACNSCHGEAGASVTSIYPKLNGQTAGYIATQAIAIRDGVRKSGMSAIMKPMVASISNEEMEAIADYLASK